MNIFPWEKFQILRDLLRETAPPPDQQALRLRTVERDVILPVKAAFLVILAYYLFLSPWFKDDVVPGIRQAYVAQQTIRLFFLMYLPWNLLIAVMLLAAKRLPLRFVQRAIFAGSFIDGMFVGALTLLTGGFDSVLFWIFPGLIVRNAVSLPRATPQLLLNFLLSVCYVLAGALEKPISAEMTAFDDASHLVLAQPGPELRTEPFLMRLTLLWLVAVCCYGVQVLFEKQRRAAEEAHEFAARQEQLRSAGRLAAQIAHQIKNPLGIINNAAFSLQRVLPNGSEAGREQIRIIREEISRADRIITKLMGYAQLAEGQVEKLDVAAELDRALAEVFPPAANYKVQIRRDYAPDLPALMMQRNHLNDALTNLLQNAREAMFGQGRIEVTARLAPDQAVLVTLADDGPGIPPDKLDKIFQAYFTTKEKGSGLGLSIVKHNIEIYGGSVAVESALGTGTKFILHLPTRTFMRPPK